MKNPKLVILYVNDPAASADFYTKVLGLPVLGSSPKFAMVKLTAELSLGLWALHDTDPKSGVTGGGTELSFAAESARAVDDWHHDWAAQGLRIAQPPTQKEFGYTFVALDPDGHRLRILFAAAP